MVRTEEKDITSKIETFDSNAPCKECLIKIFCSDFCVEFRQFYNHKNNLWWGNYIKWFHKMGYR